MTPEATVDDLFTLAIAAEETTAEFYRGLVEKFSHESDIADFWQRYVLDEVSHALWLERLRRNLRPEQLAGPADHDALALAVQTRNVSAAQILAGIDNLDAAYEAANDLENSETNVVFEFLITNFPYDREVSSFLRTQLTGHVNRLITAFPNRFKDPYARRAVAAQG